VNFAPWQRSLSEVVSQPPPEHDLGEDPRRGRRNLLGDLVGLEFDERLVLEHEVADLPQPGADDGLGAFLFVGNPDFDQL
jgi:hypothetical protein